MLGLLHICGGTGRIFHADDGPVGGDIDSAAHRIMDISYGGTDA